MPTTLGYSQANRALKIDTALGKDKLLLRSMTGQEAISQLFRFELDLLSEDDTIKLESIIGQPVTLHVEIVDGERFFHGHVSKFSQGTRDERFTSYRAEMVPWLWFLTRTADCRIFQNKTVPDIAQQIFKDLGFSDYKLQLFKNYRSREYCVQYRETDFNFVSRLMEEEGIYYFFQHEQGKHTLILADDASAQQPCPNQPKARCEMASGGWSPDDVISELRIEQEFRPSAWAHTDYNFETPSTSLMVSVQQQPKWEIYDYPGFFPKRDEGDKLAKLRLEEATAFKQRATGRSNCRCFTSGFTTEVTDHYRPDVNQKWLLTAVHHQATMGGSYNTGPADDGMFYANSFEAIPAAVPFRPPRVTPKPHVQGCQTAVVTGPGGEEIYTEKFGRVKVQFHWDRVGKKNENSSCWIRVSHPWAGKGWGSVSIPRIGQEVVVDFLEGDPDQPIIMGRVYHAENMPPYDLPAGGVVSGLKTNSTKGGGGYNEMSMDDTKGKEKVTIHAQYDMSTTVEHDDTQTVHNNRKISVDGTHDETIKKNTSITVSEGNHSLTVTKGTHTETIKENTAVIVQHGNYGLDVQTGTHTHHVKGKVGETYEDEQATTVTKDIKVTSHATITVDGTAEVRLKCGDSFISITPDKIIVQSKDVQVLGGASAQIGVGKQNLVCDKAKTAISGLSISSQTGGEHVITGVPVKIN